MLYLRAKKRKEKGGEIPSFLLVCKENNIRMIPRAIVAENYVDFSQWPGRFIVRSVKSFKACLRGYISFRLSSKVSSSQNPIAGGSNKSSFNVSISKTFMGSVKLSRSPHLRQLALSINLFSLSVLQLFLISRALTQDYHSHNNNSLRYSCIYSSSLASSSLCFPLLDILF